MVCNSQENESANSYSRRVSCTKCIPEGMIINYVRNKWGVHKSRLVFPNPNPITLTLTPPHIIQVFMHTQKSPWCGTHPAPFTTTQQKQFKLLSRTKYVYSVSTAVYIVRYLGRTSSSSSLQQQQQQQLLQACNAPPSSKYIPGTR